MNITEALNAALPDIPARTFAALSARGSADYLEGARGEGERMVRVYVPSAEACTSFRRRIGRSCSSSTENAPTRKSPSSSRPDRSAVYSEATVREFADDLEAVGFLVQDAAGKKHSAHAEEQRRAAQAAQSKEKVR